MKRAREEDEEVQKPADVESNNVNITAVCMEAKDLCSQLKEMIIQLKEANVNEGNSDGEKKKQWSDEKIRIMTIISALRRRIRNAHFALHESSLKTQAKSDALDSLFIQKQNLLYQKLHIAKSIEPLLRIRSKADSIDLIPLEEFEKTEQYQAIEDKKDNHTVQIARLDHELAERVVLLRKAEGLQQSKKQVQIKLSEAEGLIQKMQTHLDGIKSSAASMKETISTILEEK